MEFNKYKEQGDYHWKIYSAGTDPYVKHVDRVVSWIGPGRTIDIGAGDGLITSKIIASGDKTVPNDIPKCIGIDDNQIAVNLAKQHGIEVKLISIYNIRCPYLSYFDNAFMGDVIEHLAYPDKALLRVKAILKMGGHLYITTPPAYSNGQLHDNYHYKEYTAEKLHKFVEQFGFKLVEPIQTANVRMYAKFKKVR
ncbi:MAG: methyltransferase domain-containing protein [Tannerellaceae bacterium]|nr:methyltransferase domain-containing protein [Tannerellaceae bacterium]